MTYSSHVPYDAHERYDGQPVAAETPPPVEPPPVVVPPVVVPPVVIPPPPPPPPAPAPVLTKVQTDRLVTVTKAATNHMTWPWSKKETALRAALKTFRL